MSIITTDAVSAVQLIDSSSTELEQKRLAGLPSAEEFFALINDEQKLTQNLPGYQVYHKYNKTT
jgi:hypothetical protein